MNNFDAKLVDQLIQSTQTFPVLEERNFSGIIHLLALLVDHVDVPVLPASQLATLFIIFPQVSFSTLCPRSLVQLNSIPTV